MNHRLLAAIFITLCGATSLSSAGPPPGRGAYVGPYPGGAYRPVYPVLRPPVYAGWGAGYRAPRAAVYVAAPAYWGGWPYAWGAAYPVPYALPYVVAPVVVGSTPPQVLVQQAPAAPADSYWYYCTQPAGYFPYVRSCSQPWMKVVPQVPDSNNTPPQAVQ